MHYRIYNTMVTLCWLLFPIGMIMIAYDRISKDKARSEKKDTTKMVSLTVPAIICITLGICCGIVSFMIHSGD